MDDKDDKEIPKLAWGYEWYLDDDIQWRIRQVIVCDCGVKFVRHGGIHSDWCKYWETNKKDK